MSQSNDPVELAAANCSPCFRRIESRTLYVATLSLLTLFFLLTSATGFAASLIASETAAPAIADLTATGTSDWVHWGLTSASSINRKAGVTPQIGSFTVVGGIARRYQAPAGVRVDYAWSDGTPTASATTTTGIFLKGVGNRFELSIPADMSPRTLTLYAGGWRARGRLDISLSDDSASPAGIIIDNPGGLIDREIGVDFAAASTGQSLRITYTLLDDYGVGGNITLAGAALTAAVVNQPPTLAPLGNQVVTAGQSLSFTVSASDPDGPPPLILTGAPLPIGATFSDNGDGSGQFDWTPSESDVANSPYSITFTATDGAGALADTTIEIAVRSSAARPNIVLITTDDLGYGDLGSYGSSTIATPNLDQLASDGLRFTDFYAAPVCQMARAQLMTGSYSPRVSMSPGLLPHSNFGINPNEITISELLKTNGYATAILGKWHLGDAPEFLPTQHGFDEFFGLPYSNDMWPFHPKICETPDEDPRLTAARERALLTGFAGQNTPCWPPDFFPDLPLMLGDQVVELNSDQSTFNTRFTQEALNFIRRNADQPFFLYLPYTAPHVPLFPDSAFLGSSGADLYGDTVQELDFHVGEILNELDSLGIVNNTLVIFVSDNGPWLQYGIDGGTAGPLRQGKGTVFEGGVRVPAIMKLPAEIPPGSQTQAIAGLIDIYPTIAKLAGVTVPQDRMIDGKDLTSVLRDPATSTGPRSVLYFFREAPSREVDQTLYLSAMRSDRWKLHLGISGTTVTGNALYDLETDIGESNNLISIKPAIVQNLEVLAQTFNDTLRQNTRPAGIKTPTGGGLIAADAPAPASANLTAAGTSDWVHWGLTSAGSVDRKAGVTTQISPLTAVGGVAGRYNAPAGVRVDYSWSDGTPTAGATTTTGVYLPGVGNRFELSVPADTIPKTLSLYAGGWRARGQLDIRLSDDSASPASIIIDNPVGVIDREVTINFAAASAGQSLHIAYTLLDNYGAGGNITLAGATLTGAVANQPPVLAPIGNQVITAGEPLSLPVSASDPDGPPPLILTGAPLPAGAIFADNGNGSGQFDWTPFESDVAGSPYSVTFTATDDDGAGLSDAETIQISVNSSAGGSGSLSAADAPAPASANLTATGTSDWVHWGLTSTSSINRKAGVTAQISSFTVVGGIARRYQAPAGVRVDYVWSDGTPTASATTTTGIFLRGIGNRFELSVPADTALKSLTLYAGGWRARGRLDISLSDDSASPASIIIDNPSGVIDREVSVDFAAAGAGQTLHITYTLLDDYGVGGNITLAGAALAGDDD